MFTKPIVFTDFHHGSLMVSLLLLFEKRLGGTLLTPIGLEWHTQGFWKMWEYPDTIRQFLEPVGKGEPLNDSRSIYMCQDGSGFTYKGVTLDAFYELPVDIVIASVPANVEPFWRLCQTHPSKPKLVFQIGNDWQLQQWIAPNVMTSAVIKTIPKHIHSILYHQEFDLSVFHPDFSLPGNYISSFVNCFIDDGGFAPDYHLFQTVEALMPDWTFKSHGIVCRDGYITGDQPLAEKMRKARFIWHTKSGGDGYGHIVYKSAAVGRPLIVKAEYYNEKHGKELMVDGVTCLAIDGLSPEEIVNKILYYSEEHRYSALCRNMYDNFKLRVDFDKEGEALKHFVNNLI
ncbi:hypothetical protein L1N85_23735 [Paenibacillus alkaliterrae]|uniref:hypothetical protein n=1 Tax=Paenibacillus alkaliterrae TaxID=320909 RepID=UPI001F3EDC5F|nr:hypothetical protein [Paenibacillus alkaliterrae]MCF2941363.1 hypothetical protein [Paenibacillus alkaliterrae]